MSSTYAAICVNHDPALVLEPQYQDVERILHSYRHRDSELPDHIHCDMLIGRWSGGLIAIGCPPNKWNSSETPSHYPYHPHDICWVDVCWLVLRLRATPVLPTSAFVDMPGCWSLQRLQRLTTLLSEPEHTP